MKILIVTDAWLPQINGVVRTLQAIEGELVRAGHVVRIAGPDTAGWVKLSLPTYREVMLEFFAGPRLGRLLDTFEPEAIHIATEGPLGFAMRRLCLKRRRPFTTAYHTRFPEYFAARFPWFCRGMIERAVYAYLRHFHAPSMRVLAPTESMAEMLKAHGFLKVARWSRGVDTELFKPFGKRFELYRELKRPILLYVGRVSVEKNLGAFLDLSTHGSKVVIGSGPDLKKLVSRYPSVRFLGRMEPKILARAYAAADLFVFPSKTDTFGLVLLEACAAGLRVAAYPVAGPKDLLGGEAGRVFAVLDENLQSAVHRALALPDTVILPRAFAERHSWAVSAGQFYQNLYMAAQKTSES